MSAVTTSNAASGSVTGSPRRQYVSIRPFNSYFFTYTVSSNYSGGGFNTSGTLSAVTGASATTCPAGRVLRENGKRLYPGANPGVTTLMVGVFDSITFLNGFIDPNAKVFQTQNTDIAPYLPDQVDPTDDTQDLGNGVYTRGDVRAVGSLDVSGSSVLAASTFMNGPVRIGTTGTYLTRVKTGFISVDPGSIAASTLVGVELNLAITPALTANDTVLFNTPQNLSGNLNFAGAFLSSVSTAVLRIYNNSLTTAVDDTAKTWEYTIFSASAL